MKSEKLLKLKIEQILLIIDLKMTGSKSSRNKFLENMKMEPDIKKVGESLLNRVTHDKRGVFVHIFEY